MDLGLRRRLGDNDFEYAPSIQVTYSEELRTEATSPIFNLLSLQSVTEKISIEV